VVTVTAPAGCSWTAQVSSGAPWISITDGRHGTGRGSVEYRLDENRSRQLRTGTMTIAGHTFTIRQEGRD
jgi:hypothetical protein